MYAFVDNLSFNKEFDKLTILEIRKSLTILNTKNFKNP